MSKQSVLTLGEIEELASTFLGLTWHTAGHRLRVAELTRPARTV